MPKVAWINPRHLVQRVPVVPTCFKYSKWDDVSRVRRKIKGKSRRHLLVIAFLAKKAFLPEDFHSTMRDDGWGDDGSVMLCKNEKCIRIRNQ